MLSRSLCLENTCSRKSLANSGASNGEQLEKAVGVVVGNLGSKTQFAGLDIPGDVLLHAWPKVSLGDELKGLTNPEMSTKLVVVVLAEDIQKKSVVGEEDERLVIVGSVSEGVPEIMLSEEGVPEGVAVMTRYQPPELGPSLGTPTLSNPPP
ncbi:hypothetical protein C0993_000246 [Termitomyces sp. T159_Od127]|nr:hypothetical protein C0993_000246 [Termitomyces sp. T159_Od127]